MSSFLKIQTHAFKDEDDEDEDYEICDFAMKRVEIDLNANDSNVASYTRSKVTLPEDEAIKQKPHQADEEYTKFLHTMHVDSPKDESGDEDFEIDDTEVHHDRDDYRLDKIPRQILRDLHEFQDNNSPIPLSSSTSKPNNKKVTADIRIRFHEEQRQSIRTQLKQLFQLLVIIRHLSHNSDMHKNAYILSTQLLKQFNCSRLGSIQSIRFAIANKCGVFEQFKTKHMTREEAIKIARISTQHCYIDSMMDIECVEEYFQFNELVCRSYLSVLNRFRGVLLEEQYIPKYDFIPDTPSQNRKFTKIEEKLLGLGVEIYGQKLSQPMISNSNVGINRNIMINDWTSMRDRFLPHKTIESLQKEIAKIRKLNHELRYEYRMRPPLKEMSDIELGFLARGIQKYGKHSWAKITKELLPDWTPRQLKTKYNRTLRPLIETMKYNVECNTNEIKFFNPSMDKTQNNNSCCTIHAPNSENSFQSRYTADNFNHNNGNSNIDDAGIYELLSIFCQPDQNEVGQEKDNSNQLDQKVTNSFEAMDVLNNDNGFLI